MRKICLFIVGLFLCLLSVNSVLAVVVVDENSLSSGAGTESLNALHPSTGAFRSACGQTFQTRFDGANVTSLKLYSYRSGLSTNGASVAYIGGVSGTYGTTSVPNSTVFATSDTVMVSSLGGTGSEVTFTFSTPYALVAGQYYSVYVVCSVYNASGYEIVYYDNSAPYLHLGNYFSYYSSAWAPNSAADWAFILYGDDGSPVSYNGWQVTIEDNDVITVDFNNTAVSAGDVVASGGVNVDVGGVTADFNNTVVTAGAVTAGDVTAGDFTGNITVTELVVSGGSSGVAYDDVLFGFYFLILMLIFNFVLIVFAKIPLLNMLVGFVTIALAGVVILGYVNMEIPFHPYFELFLGVIGVVTLLRARGGFD